MTNEVTTMESPVSESAALIQVIERAASNPEIDVEKMDRLLSMQERIIDRNAKQAFNEAMNRVQTAIEPVLANKDNSQTQSKYADYEALNHVVRPIYTREGFSPSFGAGESKKPDHVLVVCDLLHSGGHEKRYEIDMPADGKGAKGGDVMTKTHATGSAMSYGKRYLLVSMFNISVKGDDDDGNGAGNASLTEAQLTNLRDRLDKVSADIPAFCKYMGVDVLKDIPQAKLKQALNAVAAKENAK